MSMQTIGIVDDEPNIRQIVEAYIKKEGLSAVCFASAEEALNHPTKEEIGLWVIDLMLPQMDGYALCKRIRANSEVPIIMISAKDEEIDKVLGLELGSDDYLTKPFSPRELVARIKRHLQRWQLYKGAETKQSQLIVGDLKVDMKLRTISWRGETFLTTNKEFELLLFLAENEGQALSREILLQSVWGTDYVGSDRAVDDLVKRIRKKMPELPIESVWGFGYRLKMVGQA